MTDRREVVRGLMKVRTLVKRTHWIKGTYVNVQYLDGDGEYTDGAVVRDTKVVGCLVGLARLVGDKQPTYYKGTIRHVELKEQTDLAFKLEQAIQETIRDEFLSGYYSQMQEDDDGNEYESEPDDVSIESWNDYDNRTRDQVVEMLGRAIERTAAANAE